MRLILMWLVESSKEGVAFKVVMITGITTLR